MVPGCDADWPPVEERLSRLVDEPQLLFCFLEVRCSVPLMEYLGRHLFCMFLFLAKAFAFLLIRELLKRSIIDSVSG